jgi:hypothetical protein
MGRKKVCLSAGCLQSIGCTFVATRCLFQWHASFPTSSCVQKAEVVETVQPFCYYCDREFEDETVSTALNGSLLYY